MNSKTKPAPQFISPEGVEEEIVTEFTFRITKTQGGKFRTYQGSTTHGKGPSTSYDNRIKANKALGTIMTILGSSLIDPVDTAKFLVEQLAKELKK